MSDSREILLEAAADEFAKYGPRGTRVQDIVRAAGINERMIYHHFGSKDGLYRAVMVDQRARLGAALQPLLDEAAAMEPYLGMQLVLRGFFDNIVARPQLAALFTHEGLAGHPPAVPEGVTGPPDEIRSLYERGQAAGVFAPGVSFGVAYATAMICLMGMTLMQPQFGFLGLADLDGGPEQVRDAVVTQILDGMTG